jgi:hypothetical protein
MGTEFSPTDVQCCPQQHRTSWIWTAWVLNLVQQTFNVVHNNTGHHGSKHHGHCIYSSRLSMLSTTTQAIIDLNSVGTEFSPADVQCFPHQHRTSWIWSAWVLNLVQQTFNVVHNNTEIMGLNSMGTYYIKPNRRSMLSTTIQDAMDLNSMGTEFGPADVQCCPQQHRTSRI